MSQDVLGMIRQLNDSNDFAIRMKAVESLGSIGKPAVENLLEAMRDVATRWGAITALGFIGDDRAVDSLVKATRDTDPMVRGAAVMALGRIGGERVIEPLIQVLAAEEGVIIRNMAIDALGSCGDRRAITPLIEASKDEEASIRKHAQDALKELEQE